jgi:hypothetical protein
MATYSKAAQERIALRKLADARKFSRPGVRGFNYDADLVRELRQISDELPEDFRWSTCGGVN